MNKFFLTLVTILFVLNEQSYSQSSDLNLGLLNLTKEVSNGVTNSQIVKVAVWDFTDVNGITSTLGKYISEKISVNLVNVGKGFQVMNRNHLAQILKEHKLNSDGFIDQNTAKELGKMQAVDAIFTGSVIVFNDKIEVTLQVIETESASTIAAGSTICIMNDDIKSLLGIETTSGGGNNDVNRGFNAPLNSNEIYNNPGTVNSECNKLEIGDYCFVNKTIYNMEVRIEWVSGLLTDGTQYGRGSKSFILKSGETSCFYNLHDGESSYHLLYNKADPKTTSPSVTTYAEGFIYVEQCRSKSFIIK